ncbi:MAG: hypothetical protein ABI550_01715 [Ignavibacteriaceae bacterium]
MKKNNFLIFAIIISAFSATKIFPQTNIRFEGIGGKIGFIIPENPIDNTFSISAHADLGTIFDRVFVGAIAEYWSKSYNASSIANTFFDGKWTEFIIAPTFKFKFYTPTKFITYAGGGIGFAIVSSNTDFKDGSQVVRSSESKLNAALFFLGGVEYPFNKNLKGISEIKFHINGANFFGIYAGLTYLLPLNN